MIVARAAENTVWFASCNACLVPQQNSRSLIVSPDGQIRGQTDLRREQLLVRDIDPAQATRAMFRRRVEGQAAMADTAPLLFADSVRPDEYGEAQQS